LCIRVAGAAGPERLGVGQCPIVKAPFADTVAAELKVGDPAAVLPTDTSSEEMKGRITLLSRSSDPTNRTVEVWVTLANGAWQIASEWRGAGDYLCKLEKRRGL